jgi:hypothetical protein
MIIKPSLIIYHIILIIIIVSIISGCDDRNAIRYNNYGIKEGDVVDINIFNDSVAWDLAKAVDKQNTNRITEIAKTNPEALDYQDPKYGVTLLIWAVGTEKFNSAEALLKGGSDPNIVSDYFGYTALFLASGYSWIDNAAKKDAKYVELLLQYDADPNICYTGDKKVNITNFGTSPLMESILSGLDKTKALVDAGADLNYKMESGMTAAIEALRAGGPNATIDAMRYAHYLIAEKKASVIDPYKTMWNNNLSEKNYYPVDILRNWLPKLDSEEYTLKMDIIQEFAYQGVDYWRTKIPEERLSQIKKIYPETWQDYIIKY